MRSSGSDATDNLFFRRITRKMKSCCWSLRKWKAVKNQRMLIEQLEGMSD